MRSNAHRRRAAMYVAILGTATLVANTTGYTVRDANCLR